MGANPAKKIIAESAVFGIFVDANPRFDPSLFNVPPVGKYRWLRATRKNCLVLFLDLEFAEFAYGFADILSEHAIDREVNLGVFAQESTHVLLFANPGC